MAFKNSFEFSNFIEKFLIRLSIAIFWVETSALQNVAALSRSDYT